jgi:hypothetical protein
MSLATALPLTPDRATTSQQHGGASQRGPHRLASTACERLWALRTVYGIAAKTEPPTRLMGTLIHTCLAYHFAEMMTTPPQWARDRTLSDALSQDGEGAPELIRAANDVYAAYRQRFAGDVWLPIAVEEEFAASIGELDPDGPDRTLDHEIVTCRADLVVESNGDLWIVDHKSTGGTYGDRLPAWKDDGEYKLSWQIMMNLQILRAPRNVERLGGRTVRGFIIQRIKQRTPFDFDRHVVQVPSKAYASVPRAARELVRAERNILDKIDRGEAPLPNFSMCYGRYGACDLFPLCSASTDAEAHMVMDTQFVQIGGLRS